MCVKKLALIEIGEGDAGAHLFGKGLVKDGEALGAVVHWYLFNEETDDIQKEIDDLDEFYDGFIFLSPPQRDEITISALKDIDNYNGDGFFYENGIVVGLIRYLEDIFPEGIAGKVATVFGKGRTAGGPIIKGLRKRGVEVAVVDSKTSPEEVFEKVNAADFLVTAVGGQAFLDCTHIRIPVIDYGTPGDCINGGVKIGKMTRWGILQNLFNQPEVRIDMAEFSV